MKASWPSITVLLSTYNGARWLPELIDSIEAQTFRGWDVVVRDDGSRDATSDLLASWAKSSTRVRLETRGPRLGPSRSFMHLLGSLDAATFAFCDQDDVWHPNRLELGLDHLAASDVENDEVAVFTDVDPVDSRLNPHSSSVWRSPSADHQFATGPLLLNNAAIGATMMGTAALARSAVRLAAGEPVGMHDWWCALVASARGSLVFEPRATLRWRRHALTFTGKAPRGLSGRLARRRAYLSDARDMARYLLNEPDAILSKEVMSALVAMAETEPEDLTVADYRRLEQSGVRAPGWRRRVTLWAACADPSNTTAFGLGSETC